ncbi:hypothetical protein AMTRI_Chr07g80140 [Amborella trichopoda]
MGFFTEAYDLFSISSVTKLLGRIYYYDEGSPILGSLPLNVTAAVNGVTFCGNLVEQLFFGWLGDKMGPNHVYGMTLMLMVVSSIGSGLSFGPSPKSVIATLIGGDYPLSATIMAEYANKKTRGSFIAEVFAMQGFGILGGGMVAIVVSATFRAVFPAPAFAVAGQASTVALADYVWRIILMFGPLPTALTYYWWMRMPETARYTALVTKDANQAAADMSKVLQVEIKAEPKKLADTKANSFSLFRLEFAHRHGLHLFATATTWFLFDNAFYSQNLFQKDIFSARGWISPSKTMNVVEEVFVIAHSQTLIALCSTIPVGFIIFIFALAIPYEHWTHNNQNGFVNFGPNATTFVVPAEIFSARLRSTCHGISAASGKAGAIVGAFGFLYAAQNKNKKLADPGYPAGVGMKNSLIVLVVINLLGALIGLLAPEPKGKSLEEISGENQTHVGQQLHDMEAGHRELL